MIQVNLVQVADHFDLLRGGYDNMNDDSVALLDSHIVLTNLFFCYW